MGPFLRDPAGPSSAAIHASASQQKHRRHAAALSFDSHSPPSAPPQNPSYPNFTQAPSKIHAGRPSMSPDPSKNWMTTNTYETTPRFSRLGMAASNVVLPTPARDYKRRASGDWRPTSLPPPSAAHLHLPQKPPPHIAHKSSLRTLSSASSSRETLPLSFPSSMVPSRRSSSDIGTVVEDSEEEEDAEREAGKASCASIGIGIGLSGELKVQKGYPLIEITPTDTHIRETPARSPPVSSRCESVAEPMPLLKKVKASWMAEGRINAPERAQQPACCQDAGAKGNAADARAGSVTSCWNRLLRRGSQFGRDPGL
ncbi:hypothetical protein LshimejAT787_0705370 [Lyophyllum shimeji]|uniref:Uncharacterized protein n=1 Tax=Lyophyllum shimeji TaxID=47721 RepID=A0A9P3PP39_LYOSH|nr:hypothetical protein LshimejAT787_0705370 [Lyophyllum shimeji]